MSRNDHVRSNVAGHPTEAPRCPTRSPSSTTRSTRYKDYAGEAARLTELIRARNPSARTLLDVACGTGKHLEALRSEFEVEGVDIDEGLLAIARGRLGSVPLHTADMRDFDLGRRFDAVTCLFSAIGHVADGDELDAAVASMARHLEPGGVLIVEPWLEPDVWEIGPAPSPHGRRARPEDRAGHGRGPARATRPSSTSTTSSPRPPASRRPPSGWSTSLFSAAEYSARVRAGGARGRARPRGADRPRPLHRPVTGRLRRPTPIRDSG